MSTLIRFIRDVSSHQLEVIREDGLYRHLRFSRPTTRAYSFDIVTWPGYLTVTGDMGTWTFSRIADMFEFFTDKHFGRQDSFQINPCYWSEKFESGAGRGRTESPCYEFDEAAFEKMLDEWHAEWLADAGEDADEFDRDEVAEKISDLKREGFSDANQAYGAVDSADLPGFDMQYAFEGRSMQKYSHHYVWICYAIAWGIERYNNKKLVTKAMSTFFACQPASSQFGETPNA
ncbi:hypothetical protein [Erwinia rhapontici]|uniref:hypothetical protein n=1 Tax=Erwinia rhapontici TaxID=55212 RepID=UPI00216A08C8|nr:hypothetical protein [Erwinia rhapontici]MCS3605288.1 hypothetical protein [Erwinia rhapontici]